MSLLLLTACRGPAVDVRAQVPHVDNAVSVPMARFLWHARDDVCDGARPPWIDAPILAVLDVDGDEVSFAGERIASLSTFAAAHTDAIEHGARGDDEVRARLAPLADAEKEWSKRCRGSEPTPAVLVAVDAGTPVEGLKPLLYSLSAIATPGAFLVDDATPDADADAAPPETDRVVTIFIDEDGVELTREYATARSADDVPGVRTFVEPEVGCAVLALGPAPASFGRVGAIWDALRGRAVKRITLALPLPFAASVPRIPPGTGTPRALRAGDTVAVLPLYNPPPFVYDGADRCGTNPSFRVPNIECECMSPTAE